MAGRTRGVPGARMTGARLPRRRPSRGRVAFDLVARAGPRHAVRPTRGVGAVMTL